jgi:hypothetical protein
MGRQAASSVTATLESAEQFISIGTYDWYVSKSWNRLHAVTEFTDEHKADMEMEWAVLSPVRLACGRTAASLWIPGMFSRMGAERCKGCCRATGMPAGKGSPKNDDACRAILGLPANGDAAIVEKVTA